MEGTKAEDKERKLLFKKFYTMALLSLYMQACIYTLWWYQKRKSHAEKKGMNKIGALLCKSYFAKKMYTHTKIYTETFNNDSIYIRKPFWKRLTIYTGSGNDPEGILLQKRLSSDKI